MKKYSLGMLKPDAIEKNLENEIYKKIEESGLKVLYKQKLKFTNDDVNVFYEESIGQNYFNRIVEYITRDLVEIFIVVGDNAVDNLNKIVGSTDPKKANKGTLRRKYGNNILENTIHSSNENRVDIEIELICKKTNNQLFSFLLLEIDGKNE